MQCLFSEDAKLRSLEFQKDFYNFLPFPSTLRHEPTIPEETPPVYHASLTSSLLKDRRLFGGTFLGFHVNSLGEARLKPLLHAGGLCQALL